MNERIIKKSNKSDQANTIILECLALPSTDRPKVEVVYEEGTLGTDLDVSDTFSDLLNHLGLNDDPDDRGCNTFYLTIGTMPPAKR
jgi:hypothetical protein